MMVPQSSPGALARYCFLLLILAFTAHSLSFGSILGFGGSDNGRIEQQRRQKPLDHSSARIVDAHDGSAEVQEAMSHLRSINVSNRVVKADKSTGILATTAYYAKEVFVLLFMKAPKTAPGSGGAQTAKLAQPLSTAVSLLEKAVHEHENPDATFLLAEMNFWGNFSHPRNYKAAFAHYQSLADLTGNATAQRMLGFLYATGLGNAVERNQAKAQLFHTFAAEQGDTRSEMTLAFRSHAGIGTRSDCDVSAEYYRRVADKAVAYARSGPPGGLILPQDSYRLADEVGGVYGEGASFSSSGMNAHRMRRNHEGDDNMLEYLDLLSRTGDWKATFSLGRLYYYGERGLRRNFRLARFFFAKVARKYWDEDDNVISHDEHAASHARLASKAAAYLGRFHLRGEGVKQDFKEAKRWFDLGLATGEPACQHELGLLYLLGLGVRKDPLYAADLFKQAASQDWPPAQARMGRLFLDQGDLPTAHYYFKLAAQHGNIDALYYLAEINALEIEGRHRNCDDAKILFKAVAEKAEPLHSDFAEANALYEDKDVEGALVRYMMAAEQGYESAQANVAWLLDEQGPMFDWSTFLARIKGSDVVSSGGFYPSVLKDAALALIYWTRSARQRNADSAVKMGDYYFNGFGTPKPDVDKALICYSTAADAQGSSQARWNLGWMYENGVGTQQDFHLAKRYYDLALEAAPESYLPVKLALWKLRVRSRWNDWVGGGVKSMEYDDEPVEPKYKTWREWLANFLEDEHPYYHDHEGEDGPYGGARRGEEGGEDGYLEWDGVEGDGLGTEDYYTDEVDDSVLETLVIFILLGALSWLVYYRQQRQLAQQRQQQQRQQQAVQAQIQAQHQAAGNNQQQQQQQQQQPQPPPPPARDPNLNNIWRGEPIGH